MSEVYSMNDKILLQDTSKGDSRTSGGQPTLCEVEEATNIHQYEVKRVMEYVAEEIKKRGEIHDWTKSENFNEEYGYLVTNDISDEEFLASDWWWKHITLERHHCKEYAHLDINLIDIIEMICDRVTAEKGRTGNVNMNYLDLNPLVLVRAYYNTIKLLDDKTELVE